MRILVYSDLHLEFSEFIPPEVSPDLVILAGDISIQARGVIWASYAFDCPVLYVPGKHEYYRGHIQETFLQMQRAASSHVHVMDNARFVHGGVRFLMATGWTDFTSTGNQGAAMCVCTDQMDDYRMIRAGESCRLLRPSDLIERNQKARDFLARELTTPFGGKTVVATHHCPVPEVARDKHMGHLAAGFTNRWYYLVERADFWVFGHTHQFVDSYLGDCRVISNPRGYPNKPTGFQADFTFEI